MKSRFDFLGVCCLALAVVLVCPQDVFGQTITLPPQPFWHFAVRSADQSVISIIFSGTWVAPDGSSGFSEQRYQVQRSSTPDFSKPVNIPGPYTNLGVTWMAVDSGVGRSSTLPYYRVVLYSGSGQNSILTTSPPIQPFEQAGNTFVVNGAPSGPSGGCGDLLTAPCSTLANAITTATPGSKIYVTPGIYTGPGNTGLSFAGKAVTLQSTNGPQVTMINCTDPSTGTATRAFTFEQGEGRDTIVSGFTVANGVADTGGCISITNGSPTIANSIFLACNATTGVSRGGAIYAYGNPSPGPLISETAFIFNWGIEGAAIYVGGDSAISVQGCSFQYGICPSATGRGGALCVVLGNATVSDSVMENHIVGAMGGAIMLERAEAIITNVSVTNNTAGSFGGAFNLFGAYMNISKSNVSGNYGSIFAGGVIVTSSVYQATDTLHNYNWGRVGGGAVKVVGGQAHLTRCEIKGNSGGYGAGFDIAKQTDLSTMYTQVRVVDSVVRDNVVSDRGAAFYLDSFDSVSYTNVLFYNNTATKGGAGFCNAAGNPALFSNVTFENNVAQIGGGMFIDNPCQINLDNALFIKNSAVDAGAGIATGDGVVLNISNSYFEANGLSDCISTNPPTTGGGIMVGVQQFQINDHCGAGSLTKLTQLHLSNTSFNNNLATSSGGAISVQSGILNLDGVDVVGNKAVGSSDNTALGLGGGIAIIEQCTAAMSLTCSTAIARITNTNIVNNSAVGGGGGLHFAGQSVDGSLILENTIFTENYVATTGSAATDAAQLSTQTQQGVGGGAFIGRSNFTMKGISFDNNAAYYGGGLFLSADLSPSVSAFKDIVLDGNSAVLGSAVYWLVSASPKAPLPLASFSIMPFSNSSVSTEVLSVAFATPAPTVVQSASDMSTFSISLLDYYNNTGTTEIGSCLVKQLLPPSSLVGNETLTIRPQGSDVGIAKGEAVFSQLSVTGIIGQTYNVSISCTPHGMAQSQFLNLTGQPLPPLPFNLYVAPCASGNEPKSTGSGSFCVQCPFNTYNFDGENCLTCPRGAICPGGNQLASQSDWWRSASNSTEFYPCRTPGLCQGGIAAGNAACASGSQGPLCAVCKPNYFAFAGQCHECNQSGQAQAMLSVTIIVIVVLVALLFLRDWDFGDPSQPGPLTILKVLITHFQILALFRDYDVLWPKATSTGFSWFDTFNLSISMMAPACFMSSYNFWTKWLFEMLLPIGAVGLSVAVYFGAKSIIFSTLSASKRRGNRYRVDGATLESPETLADVNPAQPDGEQTLVENNRKPNRDWSVWLEKLEIRCFKNAFWFVTLLYPRASMTALQMFGIQTLNIGTYLTADYSIQVRPPGGQYTETYIHYIIPGAIMLFLFAVVIPALWFYMIWRVRSKLDQHDVAQRYGFLYGSYSRKFCYWETVEALRKFSFAFIPVFIKPNSAGSIQGALGQILCMAYLVGTVWLKPFALARDNYLYIASQSVLYLVLLSGSVAKWANLSWSGMQGLAAAQLVLSSGIAFATVALILTPIVRWLLRFWANKRQKMLTREAGSSVEDVPMDEEDSSPPDGSDEHSTEKALAPSRKESLKDRLSAMFTISVRAGPAPIGSTTNQAGQTNQAAEEGSTNWFHPFLKMLHALRGKGKNSNQDDALPA